MHRGRRHTGQEGESSGSGRRLRRGLRRGLGAVVPAFLLALLAAAPALAQQELTLAITDLDLSRFPTASAILQVGGPAALEAGELSAESATVQVDGQAISTNSLKPTNAEPLPTATLLLIDESGSMRGEAIQAARRAAETYIGAMRDVDVVAVQAFNEKLRVLADYSSDPVALMTSLSGLEPGKETALYSALLESLETAQRRTDAASRYIIVLSDGGDTASTATLDQVLAAGRAAGVQVYAVGLKTDEFDAAPLVKVTEATGGRYLETPDPTALSALYASLATEIQNQYVLGFEMAEPTEGGTSGRLDVTITAGDATASNSRGFFYPDRPVGEGEATTASPPVSIPTPQQAAVSGPTSAGILAGIVAWEGSDIGVAVLTAILLFLAVYLVAVVLFPRRDALTQYSDILDNRHHLGPKAAATSNPRPGEQSVNRLLKARGWGDPIQRRIEDAGWRLRTSEFVLIQLTAVVACAVLIGLTPLPFLLKAAILLIIAVGPLVYLDSKARRRRQAFEDQVPDVLTLMASSLRAGQGFEQALQVVADEGPDPSAHEFRRLLAQQRLGVSAEETLRTLADRMQSEAFGWVVMVTAIQREVGGNLAEVYTNIAETLRERAKLRREVKTLTAEGMLSAIILILLPLGVATAIYTFNRGYLMLLFTNHMGQVMLGGVVMLMAIGIMWIRRIIRFDI